MTYVRAILSCAVVLTMVGTSYAADTVTAVPSGQHVVVTIDRIPVRFTLADITIPERGQIPQQAKARLTELALDQSVQVIFKPEFGVDENGTGKIHIKRGAQNLNAVLATEGLAIQSAQAEASSFGNMVKYGQEDAQSNQAGVWGLPAETPTASQKTPPAAPVQASSSGAQGGQKGDFVAELSGRYYYAVGDSRADSISQRRRIYYSTEADAKRAGKQTAPEEVAVEGAGIEQAEALLAAGEKVYAEAIAAGNTGSRDDLYGEAFRTLTQALQVWSRLAEENPSDSAIAEKLRRTMQLRYGAMKQRRF